MGVEKVTETCSSCDGTGVNTGFIQEPEGPVPGSTPCIRCEGTGILPHAILSQDLIDSLNDTINKVNDIKQKVDEIKTKVDTL